MDDSFEFQGWGTLNENEKAAWLSKFILGKEIEQHSGILSVNGQPAVLDSNLITECEEKMPSSMVELYVRNCMSEAGALAYQGLSKAQRQSGEGAFKYYKALLTLPKSSRIACLYWAYKGERV